jgi:hypothetical protein
MSERSWRLHVMFAASAPPAGGDGVGDGHNAGFLTSLYVLFTPIVGWLLYQDRPRPIVWVGARSACPARGCSAGFRLHPRRQHDRAAAVGWSGADRADRAVVQT